MLGLIQIDGAAEMPAIRDQTRSTKQFSMAGGNVESPVEQETAAVALRSRAPGLPPCRS